MEDCRKPVKLCKKNCTNVNALASIKSSKLDLETIKQTCYACNKDVSRIEQFCLQKLFNNDFFWS